MSWLLLVGVVCLLGLSLFGAMSRRAELAKMEEAVADRTRAKRAGSEKATLHHPVIDLTRCLGCGTCVDVCPEEGVLELVHGQAQVVNGTRCVGHSACERECPVGAITVTIANLKERKDIPAVEKSLEAVGVPGLFLAGEVTAQALIKPAIDHGVAVGGEVAERVAKNGRNGRAALDLLVVGLGPAGLACSLEAKKRGLSFVTLEQETAPGGTVAKYPRRKLVLTQPVDMPLCGRLKRTSYEKEELIALWEWIIKEHELPIRYGETFTSLTRDEHGHFVVRTQQGEYVARHVCLALGRRGVPQRLGVPGEDLPKVSYSLLDAHSYENKKILVVGGGDSAAEAAMALAERPGNQVTLSYRKESFFRIRSKNERRLKACIDSGDLKVVLQSEVTAIRPQSVDLAVRNGKGRLEQTLANDHVFVMAGGTPPVELLEGAGVSFDSSLREPPPVLEAQGTGLVRALAIGFVISLGALAWALWHSDYYQLSLPDRPAHLKHNLLRPAYGVGLWLGISALVLICVNLLYLARRSPRIRFTFGSLQAWMTSHVATGLIAFLCAMLHGAMAPGDSSGGHAFWALVVLLVSGAIGRYFYAYVPHATNGRELELAEVMERFNRIDAEWGAMEREFRERAHQRITALTEKRWKGSFLGRVLALLGVGRELRHTLDELIDEGLQEGVPEEHIRETVGLARRAHRAALLVAHYEDLRAILNTWRWLHRWVALLMVLLVVVHVTHALFYGTYFAGSDG